MMRRVLVICVVVGILVGAFFVEAKKKCAPDSPHDEPITKEKNGVLPFCIQHQNLSCCDATEAKAIQRTVGELMDPQCPNCYQMVMEWKCSECHPHAGKFYKNERSSIRLCEEYCISFFEKCKDIPFDMFRHDGGSSFYLNSPKSMTAEQWCKGNVGKEGRCFRGTVPEGTDGKCKCPNQKCHIKAPKHVKKGESKMEL